VIAFFGHSLSLTSVKEPIEEQWWCVVLWNEAWTILALEAKLLLRIARPPLRGAPHVARARTNRTTLITPTARHLFSFLHPGATLYSLFWLWVGLIDITSPQKFT
jgi:hypothetical protein